MGLAADRAVPGDVLYPLDRALEALGFDSDLVEERLLEAITLAERGDMALAIETANEALAELGRSGVTATLPAVTPDTATLTAETVESQSTTTTENEDPGAAPIGSSEVDDGADDAADPASESTAAVEPVEALRLAAEQLLQSVRSAKTDGGTTEDVTAAAIFLAEATATANVTSIELSVASTTTSSTSSTTTTPSSTTTTTTPDEPRPGNRSGTDDESGTTTTTVASDPDDGSGSNDSSGGGKDGSTGPIFLPSP